MDMKLSDEAARVLGCLVEKELATPEYYPLSPNGLVSACNQKTNRDPVMAVELEDVGDAIDELRQAGLAFQAAESSRVPRFGHNLRGKLHLDDEQAAVLCELLLRGPQTPGELRGRASRLHAFPDIADVDRVLQVLAQREPALVVHLPLQPGCKEQRWAHLLSGPVKVEAPPPAPAPPPHRPPRAPRSDWPEPLRPAPSEPSSAAASTPPRPALPLAALAADDAAHIARLEDEVRLLRAEVEGLKQVVQELRRRPG